MKFPKSTRTHIKARDHHECFFCLSPAALTVAHVFVPNRDGGKAHPGNGICICRTCHDAMDFGIGLTDKQTQKRLLELCKLYLLCTYPDLDVKSLTMRRKK